MKLRSAILPALFILLTSQLLKGQDTLLVNFGLAQKRQTDSVLAADYLFTAKNFFLSGTVDSAVAYAGTSLNLAYLNDFTLISAGCYELFGAVYSRGTDLEGILSNYLKASMLYGRAGLPEREAAVLTAIGDRYFSLGAYYKSAGYYEQAFSFYHETSKPDRAEAAEKAAISWYSLPNDSLSLLWFLISSDLYADASDREGELRVAWKLTELYVRMGEFDSAMRVYEKLLSEYKETNDYRQAATVYNNMGFLRSKLKDYDNAIKDFQAASDYSSRGGNDPYFLTDVNTNLGIACQATGRQKEMMQYFSNAMVYAGRSERPDQEARIDHILAIIYFKKEDNYHAELYCRDCIESAGKSIGDTIMKDCYMTLSGVMEKGNDYPKALQYYEKYLNIRDSLNLQSMVAKTNESDRIAGYDRLEEGIRLAIADEEIQGLEIKKLRAESSEREKEVSLLLKQQELERSKTLSLSQTLALERERLQRIRREQDVMQLKQKQKEDSLDLELQQKAASVLEQKNINLEIEKKRQDEDLLKQKKIQNMTYGLVALMVMVAAMILAGLVSTRRKNQKLAERKAQIEKINSDLEIKNTEVLLQNEKISQQKDIIEQKNQSITDSIQYASRIQSAVLPPVNFLTEWGIDNFILYKPKDIVSGDFYWGKHKDNRIIVAAADCTGHGVPGAFMSMLGHAFLDEIINTSEIKDAAAILNLLRDEIINTLKQRGMVGEARDGMDISLCIIDREKGKIDFAGANNPLYLIRNCKLTKLQADRMPIGIHVTTLVPFTNNVIEIKKGDHIYIFSDGYADQFGGPKGKKFMYKPFQDLLLRNHGKPMEEQREILEKTLAGWIGDKDQVDDVLVIGMKL